MKSKLSIISLIVIILSVWTYAEVDARRFGGSSFSSSRSFSSSNSWSSSKSSFSNTKKSTSLSSIKSKSTSKPKQMKAAKKPAVSKTKISKQKAKTKYVSKFKKSNKKKQTVKQKAVQTSKLKGKYKDNKIAQQTSTYNPSTYQTRRTSYYRGYDAPTYVYYGSSSYGMWDTMFLYMMLDNSNNAFAYNHYNDSGYTQWRQEANLQARENTELRAKLERLDREVSQMSGKRDSNYLPDGVDADIALSQDVTNAVKPTLTICTGGKDGMYYHAGIVIANGVASVTGKVLRTEGTMDNFKKIDDGQCDAAFIQRDGYWIHAQRNKSKLDYSRISSIYTEYAHLVCNSKSDIDSINDLDSDNTVLVGYEDSGSYLTWTNFVAENSDYSKVNTQISKSTTGNALKVSNGQADCFLSVSGINAKSMRNTVQLGSNGSLKLASITDGNLDNLKDPGDKPIYEFGTINKNTYGKLQTGFFGRFKVDTVTVDMDMVISNKWKTANSAIYDALLEEINSVIPSIRDHASEI